MLLKQLIFQKKESQRLRAGTEALRQKAASIGVAKVLIEKGLGNSGDPEFELLQEQFSPNYPPKVPNLNLGATKASWGASKSGARLPTGHSRRNGSYAAGQANPGSRPRTAAMGSLPRPPTAAQLNFLGASRAKTAAVPSNGPNPRVKRYEEVIVRLKRLLGQEKRTLRRVRNACAKEIETKAALEKILRACLDDVKNEIAKKRSQSFSKHQNIYCKRFLWMTV